LQLNPTQQLRRIGIDQGNLEKPLTALMTTGKINICQPGHKASCGLCCGSHNYNAPPHAIAKLFRKRTEQFNRLRQPTHYNLKIPDHKEEIQKLKAYIHSDSFRELTLPKIHRDGIQCPSLGFIDHENNIIGCLLYQNNNIPDLRFHSFQDYTCKNFFCTAKNILTEDEIIFASELMRDWYYYSLLINGIELLKEIIEKYRHPENVPDTIMQSVKRALLSAIRDEKREIIP
jgi:hypothetical protein